MVVFLSLAQSMRLELFCSLGKVRRARVQQMLHCGDLLLMTGPCQTEFLRRGLFLPGRAAGNLDHEPRVNLTRRCSTVASCSS
eukprot:NODE_30158_length_426_cov_1.010033.p1 GENE.NODE_30158_length_426_cov_1.010033~~NODE_30158_length_426_cov_1.010033.p1  ORF type:complete len:83 (+),score=5.46 NODE_30158_length_426_cov_1.010033:50-298(+)